MGYTKIIIYGNNLDLYEYEKEIIRLDRRKQYGEEYDHVADLGTDGENPLPERDGKTALGRRPDNAWRASLAFRRTVACNLGGFAKPLLVTLTYRDNFTDLKGAYKHLSTFIQSLRRQYGKTFKYICVPEFQVRGAVHFHTLFWRLPSSLFLQERKTRKIAGLWGRGYVFMKETDGDEKISFYLAKYMSKAFIDSRLKNQKSYVASRNIERPIIQSSNSPMWPIIEDYGFTEPAVVDKTYSTEYLGKGRYRLFKISNSEEKE